MSTALPEHRNVPKLTDEQVIEQDRWYPHTVGRAVVYAAWVYLVAIGAVTAIEMQFSLLRDGLNYWGIVPAALASAIGLYFSRGNRRDRVRGRLTKQTPKRKNQVADVGSKPAEPVTPTWALICYAVSIGFALFGFLSLMNHLGISGPLNWFIFAMCFIPVALLMWFSYLGRSTNKEGRQ